MKDATNELKGITFEGEDLKGILDQNEVVNFIKKDEIEKRKTFNRRLNLVVQQKDFEKKSPVRRLTEIEIMKEYKMAKVDFKKLTTLDSVVAILLQTEKATAREISNISGKGMASVSALMSTLKKANAVTVSGAGTKKLGPFYFGLSQYFDKYPDPIQIAAKLNEEMSKLVKGKNLESKVRKPKSPVKLWSDQTDEELAKKARESIDTLNRCLRTLNGRDSVFVRIKIVSEASGVSRPDVNIVEGLFRKDL